VARVDEINLEILKQLQANGRMTIAELAQLVGRSESTVRERVTSLELAGILQGYEAKVDWAKAGLPAHAVVRAGCDLARIPQVARALRAVPHCTRALFLTGPKPILAILRVRDIQHLHSLLRDLGAVVGLTDVEADIALECLVDQRPPLPVSGNAQDLLAAPESR
jgi:Lrp/AsnC family transcriptional regulator, leucine-responsive regulatory protein